MLTFSGFIFDSISSSISSGFRHLNGHPFERPVLGKVSIVTEHDLQCAPFLLPTKPKTC